jgi:hypothetical protein
LACVTQILVPDDGRVHYCGNLGACRWAVIDPARGVFYDGPPDGAVFQATLSLTGAGQLTSQMRRVEPFLGGTWHYATDCSKPEAEVGK